MSRRLDRPLGVAAIAALAVALGAVAVVQWLGSRTLPEAFQYVVPNANGYLVTGPLRDLRRLGPKHGARVFSQAASSEGKRLTEQVNEELNNRCLTWDDLSEPAKLGLDDTRGASFSIVDNQAVAALPVADSQRFAMFVDRFNASRNLSLSADVPANKVLRAIRIDSNQSKGVRICGSSGGTLLDLPDGTSVELSPWEAQDVPTVQALKVTVSRIGGGTAEVRLRCTGLFTDGTSSNCTCQFGKQPEKNCTTQAVALEPMQAEATASGRLKLIRGGVSDSRFHLLDDRMALLGGGDDAAVQAVANAGENFRFFRGDDTLLATIRHLKKVAGADDGIVFGAVPSPILPITGRAHFVVSFGPQQLTARVLLPWQTLQSTFLEQTIAPAPVVKSAGSLSADAELRINDPALGYYLRFIEGYSEEARQQLRRLGSFEAFVREIKTMSQVGALRFGARGVREGVPDLAMSLEIGPTDAEDLLLKQRIRMRLARDLDILVAAAKTFVAERPQEQLSDIVQLSTHGYLKPEPGALWDRYQLAHALQSGEDIEWEKVFNPPNDLQASDFAKPEYDVTIEGRSFRYVPPPITDNDLIYRVGPDPDNKIDEAALKAGRFRMAAYVDESRGRLVVASDKDTLRDVVTEPTAIRAETDRDLAASKVSVVGDPRVLISQGLLYPDERLGKFIRDYLLDLEQYRRLKLTVEPLPSRQGISTTIVLSHE